MKTIWVAGGIVVSSFTWFSSLAVLPENWIIRSSPTANDLNGVGFGNGLFVGVGDSTTILTSSNGADWTARSAGITGPTLNCAAFGLGRYVLGGENGALILSSVDGIHWSNVLSTIGTERILGITFGYGAFVAVGAQATGGYILTSSNGLDWVSQTVPTTNALLAVSPAFGANGVGFADQLYVAVGENGTLITSTNGQDWLVQNSGTSVTLRAVVFQNRFLVGGDFGIVLASSDGVNWPAAAPASFHIHGMASTGSDAVVAVGNNMSAGALQASSDGLTWPGLSTQFAEPLNGVVFGGGSFVAVGGGGIIVQSANAAAELTNDWTKTTSGYWEEPFWSLGVLPALNQDLVAFRNPGFKALAIGQNTTANFTNSLAIRNLLVDAPANSINQLLLNYAGLTVPLSVSSNFVVGTNGSLVGFYTAVTGGNLSLSTTASFSAGCVVTFDQIVIGDAGPAELDLTNSCLTAGVLDLGQGSAGTLNQSGGSTRITNLLMPGTDGTSGNFFLRDGMLVTSNLTLGAVLSPEIPPGRGNLVQNGGVHTNSSMRLEGEIRKLDNTVFGSYSLFGGQLSSTSTLVIGGAFSQGGGTNYIQELMLDEAGSFIISDGDLFTSNTTVTTCCCVPSNFIQNGGNHLVQNRLLLQDFVHYQLRGGTLSAPLIEVGPGAQLSLQGGAITSSGLLIIRGGVLSAPGQTAQLEQLQVIGEPAFVCFSPPQPTNSELDVGVVGATGSTVLRFADSHAVPWLGSGLSILHWSPSTNGFGPDHIFFGTNALGLTATQLSQAIFVNPTGWPPGDFPATILTTGEIVPALPPPLALMRTSNSLVLSWTGPYTLLTATNVVGPYVVVPGASSPETVALTGAQGYFRLGPPTP